MPPGRSLEIDRVRGLGCGSDVLLPGGDEVKLAIILAEYGKPAPDVSQYRECWPEADIQVFGGNDLPETPRLDPAHPRYGWRMNDWGKIRKCLDSGSDVAISFDADMWIRDRDAARQIVPLAMTFGICMPINPRYVVKRDFVDGADTPACIDQTTWYGPSFNCSPVAINLGSKRSVWLAEEYCRIILQTPQRGPLAWWEAMKFTGVIPLPLPPQFCVCERHIGVGDEAILHMGHAAVARHYGKAVVG